MEHSQRRRVKEARQIRKKKLSKEWSRMENRFSLELWRVDCNTELVSLKASVLVFVPCMSLSQWLLAIMGDDEMAPIWPKAIIGRERLRAKSKQNSLQLGDACTDPEKEIKAGINVICYTQFVKAEPGFPPR